MVQLKTVEMTFLLVSVIHVLFLIQERMLMNGRFGQFDRNQFVD